MQTQQLSQPIAVKPILTPMVAGYIAMTVVLLIWSSFALSVRGIGGSDLTTADVALIRFLVPSILLLPFLPSRIQTIKNAHLGSLPILLLSGIPFFVLAALGAKSVPAAYVGNILAGAQPLFVSILLYCVYRQTVAKGKILPLAIILSGVLVMILAQPMAISTDMTQGLLLLIAGSVVWALYTIGLKQTTLGPISIALIVSFSSTIVIGICMACGLVDSNLADASFQSILPFIVIQGIGVGVISTLGYTYAVSQIGPSKAVVLGSLSPALTAALAVPIFNEQLTIAIVVGIVLTTTGVIFFSRKSLVITKK